jgi:hypothetical protein
MSYFLKKSKDVTPRNQRPFFANLGAISGHIVNFAGGILSNQNLGFNSTIEKPSNKDYYLHLKFIENSNLILSAEILDESQVLEVKSNNDRLFNIFLPIVKRDNRNIYYYGIFNLIPSQIIGRCVSYKNDGKLKTTPFLLKTYNYIKKVIDRSETDIQDCLFLDFSAGNIDQSLPNSEEINPRTAEITGGTKTQGELVAGQEETFALEGDEEVDLIVGCSVKIPLAFKNDDGEIVNCQQGNVDFTLDRSSMYSTEFENLDFFLVPDFEDLGSVIVSDLEGYYPPQ